MPKVVNIQPTEKNKKLARINERIPTPLPKLHFNMIVLAPTGTGKSVMIRNLLMNNEFYNSSNRKTFDNVFILNPNYSNSGDELLYDLPEENIETDIDEADNFLDFVLANQSANKDDVSLLICDDAMTAFNKRSKLSKILSRSRHNRLSMIVVSQYLKILPPVTRSNGTCFVIFKNQKKHDLKLLEELAPDNNFFEKWEILEQDPSPFSFLFIDFKNTEHKYWLNFDVPI